MSCSTDSYSFFPHQSPRGVFASNVYRDEFALWSRRLNVKDVEFGKFVPQLSLPYFLKSQGYRTEGVVSLPVLNPMTKEPVTPDFLSVLFPMELILQEISTEAYIPKWSLKS